MTDQPSEQQELDLRSYLRPLWRRKWIILAIVVIAGGATYAISSRQAKSYSASTQIYVSDADPTVNVLAPGANGVPSGPELANVAQLMTAASVNQAVSRTLGMRIAAAGSVSVTASSTSSFITISATSHRPTLAARLANTYATTFLLSRQRDVVAAARQDARAAQASLASLPTGSANASDITQRASVLQDIANYRQVVLNPTAGAKQVNAAAVPGAPTSPKPKRDTIFGVVVGLVLGIIAAFCLELLDRRLVSVSTVESAFGRPVLAVLPHVGDPTPLLAGHEAVVPPKFVEALRSLTVMVRLASHMPPRTVMIASTLPREGKSTVTRDLALVYAETGKRVLVIDCDLRRPSMARLFGIEPDVGLVHVLREEAELSDVVVTGRGPVLREPSSNGNGAGPTHGTDNDGGTGSVDVLTHGEILESPLALMSSARMTEVLEQAAGRYDIVLLDTPPVLAVADTVPLLEDVDCVLLVARLGQTTRHAASRFRELMERLEVNFFGVIANDKRAEAEDGYGSYYGYGYGYGRKERKQLKREAAKSQRAKVKQKDTTPDQEPETAQPEPMFAAPATELDMIESADATLDDAQA